MIEGANDAGSLRTRAKRIGMEGWKFESKSDPHDGVFQRVSPWPQQSSRMGSIVLNRLRPENLAAGAEPPAVSSGSRA